MSSAIIEMFSKCYKWCFGRYEKFVYSERSIDPSKLKMAKIVPVYKADDDNDVNNYRPISLLSHFNRIFEKMIKRRMESFIEQRIFFLHHSMVSEKHTLLKMQFLTS